MRVFVLMTLFVFGSVAESLGDGASALKALIESELIKLNQGARIEMVGDTRVTSGEVTAGPIRDFAFMGDDSKGNARFRVSGAVVEVEYHAWIKLPVPTRMIRPGEKIQLSDFRYQTEDLSRGMTRELRGNFVTSMDAFGEIQARQTIPVGSYVTLAMLEHVPLVRRGDILRVLLGTNGLTVSTSGRAQESGEQGRMIRVITEASKRELVGKVLPSGTVEVSL